MSVSDGTQTVRRLAAVDVGTVTTRLLVADVSDSGIVEVARSTDITHLGEDLGATGRLAPQAMERVRQTIARYVRLAEEHEVEAYAAVATSASRDAANGAEFLGIIGQTGMPLRIIDGANEARLTFSGAVSGLEGENLLVDDIGGGSTELVFGGAAHIESARSIDIGSRRLTDWFLRSDPPRVEEVVQARDYAATAMCSYFDALPRPIREVISVAGTATSLAAIELELDPYDPARVHGYRLASTSVRAIRERLASLPLAARREVVGLHPGRAPVIVAGALILEAVLESANVDSTLVSEHDILYGILRDLYSEGRLAGLSEG